MEKIFLFKGKKYFQVSTSNYSSYTRFENQRLTYTITILIRKKQITYALRLKKINISEKKILKFYCKMHQGIKELIEKKVYCIINSSQDINITNLYTPNNTASKSTESVLLKLKEESLTHCYQKLINQVYKTASVNLS